MKISVQLYSVRDLMGKDFAGTVKAIADMGFTNVEPAGFKGSSCKEAAGLFKSLGISVPSMHAGLPLGKDKNQILDEAAQLGCRRIITGKGPDDFKTPDSIKKVCEIFNEASVNAKDAGMELGYHNHWWEYQDVNGKPAYKYMLENLNENVFLQVDTYWVKVGGQDPAAVLRELGSRVPLIHLKDGPGVKGVPNVALGEGVMDFSSIMRASSAEVGIIEFDSCSGDILQAVEKSFRLLSRISQIPL